MRPIFPDAEFEADLPNMPSDKMREVAKQYPGNYCYRRLEPSKRTHYVITAYDETPEGEIVVRLLHGSDSFLPGIEVFGVAPATLVRCSCGQWTLPSDEELEQSLARVAAEKQKKST